MSIQVILYKLQFQTTLKHARNDNSEMRIQIDEQFYNITTKPGDPHVGQT